MPQSQRPPLPVRHANKHIQTMLQSGALPPVKYQVLNCQGNDILVGRLKVETPTPTGHAFILRRYDTNAISLTTMFRAAFPNASDQDEKDEVQYVKDSFDLTGNNGSSKDTGITRLAGTWVSPDVALQLGKAYMLGDIIVNVVQAQPDPNTSYRRSGKGQMTPKASITNVVAPSKEVVETGPTTTKSAAASPEQKPTKRRREASPVPEPSPVKIKASASMDEKPAPRRSTRTKSPPPKAAPSTSMMAVVNKTTASPTKTPSKRATRRPVKQEEPVPVTPGGSDETAYEDREDETQAVEDVAGSELREQDIAEQKDLIADLKRKRDAALKDEDAEMDGTDALKSKRAREEEGEQKHRFNFKEPEVGERAIATNRRVLGRLLEEPRRRSLAWGVAAFVFGAGAVTFLPNFL
ncbi:hypothetical protein V5O48_012047 [Marasmius crinis-equi]|uniref:HTH APSES-type domain-containing protein n=1 Tax=Marasmius crinis-equi TaxID=585013 RepID=A0ABR3F4H2_9AGAR